MQNCDQKKYEMPNAFKIEKNRKDIEDTMNVVDMSTLADHLIKSNIYNPGFEEGVSDKKKFIFDKIIKDIKKQDKSDKHDIYDKLLPYFDKNNKNIANLIRATPTPDDIFTCLNLAEKTELHINLLQKCCQNIIVTGEVIGKVLNYKGKDITKDRIFKWWYDKEGFRKGEVEKLLQVLIRYPDDIKIEWESIRSCLDKNKTYK